MSVDGGATEDESGGKETPAVSLSAATSAAWVRERFDERRRILLDAPPFLGLVTRDFIRLERLMYNFLDAAADLQLCEESQRSALDLDQHFECRTIRRYAAFLQTLAAEGIEGSVVAVDVAARVGRAMIANLELESRDHIKSHAAADIRSIRDWQASTEAWLAEVTSALVGLEYCQRLVVLDAEGEERVDLETDRLREESRLRHVFVWRLVICEYDSRCAIEEGEEALEWKALCENERQEAPGTASRGAAECAEYPSAHDSAISAVEGGSYRDPESATKAASPTAPHSADHNAVTAPLVARPRSRSRRVDEHEEEEDDDDERSSPSPAAARSTTLCVVSDQASPVLVTPLVCAASKQQRSPAAVDVPTEARDDDDDDGGGVSERTAPDCFARANAIVLEVLRGHAVLTSANCYAASTAALSEAELIEMTAAVLGGDGCESSGQEAAWMNLERALNAR